MKTFFESLNYSVNPSNEGKKLVYYIITNPDGSPRWIFPSFTKSPAFLKFYHIEGFRSKVFAMLSKLIFTLRLQRFVYKKEEVFLSTDENNKPLIHLFDEQWALFTGTAGPNNKMVLYAERGTAPVFMKIPSTSKATEIVAREHYGTQKIKALTPENFVIPQTRLFENGILEMDDIARSGKRSNIFSEPHKKMLTEITAKTANFTEAGKSECFQSSMANLEKALEYGDMRIPKNLFNALGELSSKIKKNEMVTTLSHGDFTPWNMFVKEDMLAVYDWELAQNASPLGFDAFHFIIQKGIMIDRKSWKEIREEINVTAGSWGESLAQKYDTTWNQCLEWYLFINISNHLELYSRQEHWHEQINWLMDTWSEALTEIMSTDQNARGLLIDDIFARLHSKPYATIKFPDASPSQLDPYSDIDICLRKEDAMSLINQLQSHSLVQAVLIKKTSFMATVQIILVNKEVLNLDLIWQLKWKHLEMMSATDVLSRAQINRYGIKVMHAFDLVQYLGLFYGLNNTLIPGKYESYLNEETGMRSFLHSLIVTSATLKDIPKELLRITIEQHPSNKGLHFIKNATNYMLDTIKSLFKPKGMIITFSGVDGAGKSTVIEHVRKEFDKKLRRKVVVLRHRPSVLPILSAWTKGKAKAEQDAASTLPRQGNNQSALSSFLRFAYYFTDYLAGQFVVYTRHVLRGDIVLYDRYYFDFINDSVRSNIRLPERFLRAGYFFLLKPDFNFFLYADADTILCRKQELDKETITELTAKYLALFNTLDSGKSSTGKYVPIENNNLEATINHIMNTTTGKAA